MGDQCCSLPRLSVATLNPTGSFTAITLRVARVRTRELWPVDADVLEETQEESARLAGADQTAAGLDILTDGKVRRESYSNRFRYRSPRHR